MTIVAVNGGGNTPQGDNNGDVDGRDFLVWQRGGLASRNRAENKDLISSFENATTIGVDTFDFQPQLTSESGSGTYMQGSQQCIVRITKIGSGDDP